MRLRVRTRHRAVARRMGTEASKAKAGHDQGPGKRRRGPCCPVGVECGGEAWGGDPRPGPRRSEPLRFWIVTVKRSNSEMEGQGGFSTNAPFRPRSASLECSKQMNKCHVIPFERNMRLERVLNVICLTPVAPGSTASKRSQTDGSLALLGASRGTPQAPLPLPAGTKGRC